MPSNIEIKARLEQLGSVESQLREHCGSAPEVLTQRDVFFEVPRGRLKLRVVNGEGQLIHYHRPDQKGPKESQYSITPVANPEGLEAQLGAALGIKGVVEKRRLLFLVGQTRVHLDDVKGLGTFLELEVVMKAGQSLQEGQTIAAELQALLGITPSQLVEAAYIDLLRDA